MNVLVAASNDELLLNLAGTASKLGYDVASATDATNIYSALESVGAPALLVLESSLPKVSGIEICRGVRKKLRGPHFYVLLIVTDKTNTDLTDLQSSGADDWMFCPVDHHELRVRLRAGNRMGELQAELEFQRKSNAGDQ